MAAKFWAIDSVGSYLPGDNPAKPMEGQVHSTGMTGVSTFVINGINAIGATSVFISELGVTVSSATGSAITFGTTYSGGLTGNQTNLHYYNYKKPSWPKDGPILGIIGNVASPSAFAFLDGNGNTATFAAGTIKQGETYPFCVTQVVAVTAEQIIGFSIS